jgi:uncharacterized protein YjiS (DUF1127 family)
MAAEIDRRTNLAAWLSASIGTAATALTRGAWLLVVAIRGRRELSSLADLNDHILADIGLRRSDLHDAYSEPLWRDPTTVLSRRASRRRTASELSAHDAATSRPSADRHCAPRDRNRGAERP